MKCKDLSAYRKDAIIRNKTYSKTYRPTLAADDLHAGGVGWPGNPERRIWTMRAQDNTHTLTINASDETVRELIKAVKQFAPELLAS